MTDRQSTHGHDCWSWGPKHYECAVGQVERLRKMHQDAYQRGLQAGSKGLREMYDAVQTVKRQDAWGNAQLTEALMEAEERAERAEAENKQLRAEVAEWKRVAAAQAELHGESEVRAERMEKALKDIRSLSSINSTVNPDSFALTVLLADIYQIADAVLWKENSDA